MDFSAYVSYSIDAGLKQSKVLWVQESLSIRAIDTIVETYMSFKKS